MSVDIVLKNEAAFVQERLQTFITNYHLLPDDKRMTMSDDVFTHLRNFFQAHHILVNAVSKRDDISLDNALSCYQAEEDEIWDIYEHTINIHVDEPYDEYKDQLERIQVHFQTFTTLEYERLLNRLTSQLSDAEKEGLVSTIRKDPEVLAHSL